MEHEFVHLHVKSEYSLLVSSAHTEDIVKRAKILGQKSIAITDVNVLFGAVEFVKCSKNAGIKPIIGMEISSVVFDINGLVLLAKNRTGYKNLIKIASETALTDDFLYNHADGLILLSGGTDSRIYKLLSDGFFNDAKKTILKIKTYFPDFYIEITNHEIAEEHALLSLQIRLSDEIGVPLVATNDVCMTEKNDLETASLLREMRSENINTPPPGNSEFYIKSADEMYAMFPNQPEVLYETVKIAEMIDDDVMELGVLHMPKFYRLNVQNNTDFFVSLCKKGCIKRFDGRVSETVSARLQYELDVIIRMGFVDYFLIVWDFVKFAHSQNIPVGPGRGSGAGSLAAYSIGITGIDPIKHNLLFERFLNPERISLPDFDIDFGDERRFEVIEYAVSKYGRENAAGIVTFSTIQGKSAVRYAAKLVHAPITAADFLAKRIPYGKGTEALKQGTEKWDESDPLMLKILDTAALIEGYPKNISTHAAGIVLADAPITEYAPTVYTGGMNVTQFTIEYLEDVGLVKMDLLGNMYLTAEDECIKNIAKRQPGFSEKDIPLDDKKTYKMLAAGHTLGVFQFSSEGITNVMKRLCPENIGDLIALNALFRPGPMDSIPAFLDAKLAVMHGRSRRRKLHPLIDDILDETYGVIVYQEQVMLIVQRLAGFSLGRADLLRRAMAKKKSDIMENERTAFIAGADQNGVPRDISEMIYREIAKFSSYAFNKSHSVAYAYLAYRTAYLKCRFSSDYMAAFISGSFSQAAINETKRLGLRFLRPDINISPRKCVAEDEKSIRFGLALVKGMGTHPVDAVMTEREKLPFFSLEDFCGRFDSYTVPQNAIENLITAGAFDSFGKSRRQMLRFLPEIMDTARRDRQKAESGQQSLFGEENETIEKTANKAALPEFDDREKHRMEIAVCGISFDN